MGQLGSRLFPGESALIFREIEGGSAGKAEQAAQRHRLRPVRQERWPVVRRASEPVGDGLPAAGPGRSDQFLVGN